MSKKTYTLAQFAEALERMDKAARGKALSRSADAGAFVIQTHARLNANAKLSKDSIGALVNSITVGTLNASDMRVEKAVGPTVIYGRIHELGGVVEAKNAPYLVFQVNGKWVKTKKVTIPARPYLRPAVDENEQQIMDAVAENLRIEIEAAL